MRKKDLKVFIGPVEVGKIAATMGNGLRQLGAKAMVVCHGTGTFEAGMFYDACIKLPDVSGMGVLRKCCTLGPFWIRVFRRYFFRNNAFIFLFGVTLLPKNLDLPLYRLFGKKTVMWFLGSDIKDMRKRERDLARLGIPHAHNPQIAETDRGRRRKVRMIRRVERYADYIITAPSIAQLIRRDYLGKELESRVYMPFMMDSIVYGAPSGGKPLVIHAPSDDLAKGTKYVMETVQRLKDEGFDFEFRLIRNMPNNEVHALLTKADIVVDQLFAFGPGMLAIEAMAAGCAVLGGNVPRVSCYPDDLPIIHTDKDSVYSNLKALIQDTALRARLGAAGRKYVLKYHDHMKIARKLADLFIYGSPKGKRAFFASPVKGPAPARAPANPEKPDEVL